MLMLASALVHCFIVFMLLVLVTVCTFDQASPPRIVQLMPYVLVFPLYPICRWVSTWVPTLKALHTSVLTGNSILWGAVISRMMILYITKHSQEDSEQNDGQISSESAFLDELPS